MAGSGSASSAWAPLRIGLFRTLWIAVLVSNVGTWMQTVGAQWLVVHGAHAAMLVSLVQTAYTLPAVLFALVGGVLADIFDRAKLLVAVLAGMTAAGAALTALTAAHRMPPALLLMFTFVLGTGAILVTPAYQSLVPEMVPRAQVPAAAALSSISINLARAIGPAIAGLLVARIGVAAVFGLNTATFLLYAIVVACHPQLGGTPQYAERFLPGLRAGGRYVRHAPVVRRILLRAALFLVPGSALWALLPLIATRRLGLGAGGYGVLLGALGVGAVGGAFILPQIRAQAVGQCPGGRRERDLRGGTGRGGAVAQPRADRPGAAAGRCGLDSLPVQRQRRAAALPAQVGTRPRPVGLPDGPVRRPGSRGGDLGSRRRGGRAGARLPDLRRRHGRRCGNPLVLAVPPDRRHGPQPGPLARTATAHQR